MTKVLAIVHLNIVIYAFAFWLTNPVLPFLMKEFGASNLSFGYFQSLFNVVQLLGGLVVGDLQDRYSGSTALSITQIGSALVYLCMFSANSLDLLYLSRIPTVLQQSMQVAQACVSKASDGETRTVSLGRLSLSYSIGMVGGALLSGRLAEAYGNRFPVAMALFFSAGIVVVNMLGLQELTGPAAPKASAAQTEGKDKAQVGIKGYLKLVAQLRRVVAFLLLLFAARSLYEPIYSLTLLEKYSVTQSTMGTLMSAFAGLGFVSNVILLPLLMRYLSETTVMRGSVIVNSLCFAALGFDGLTYELYLGIFSFMTLASAMLYTLSTSYITRYAAKSQHGQAIALTHSLRSLVGIACPVLSTGILEYFGSGSAVAWTNTALLLSSLLIV